MGADQIPQGIWGSALYILQGDDKGPVLNNIDVDIAVRPVDAENVGPGICHPLLFCGSRHADFVQRECVGCAGDFQMVGSDLISQASLIKQIVQQRDKDGAGHAQEKQKRTPGKKIYCAENGQ